MGETVTVGEKELQVRAEVAVMTRNVIVSGSIDWSFAVEIPACDAGFDPGNSVCSRCDYDVSFQSPSFV